MIKALKPHNRGGAISLRKGLERGVGVRCRETELGGNATKLDDFAAKRERRVIS